MHLNYPITIPLIIVTITFVLLFGCGTDSGPLDDHPFVGGNGTSENPFQLADLDHLVAMGDSIYLDKHFIQVADIDASASAELNNGSGFNFIGSTDHPFTGSYNGNGYIIRNLNIHFSEAFFHSGMFGYAKEALFENITIDNSQQSAKLDKKPDAFSKQDIQTLAERSLLKTDDVLNSLRSGGLVGMNDGGTVRNCQFISGEVVSSGVAAGLVGVNTGNIEHSGFTGSAVSLSVAAGLAGVNSGRISDSWSNGQVSATQTAGGLVSYNMDGEIINSFTTADVRSGFTVGGLVAHNSGQIISSFSKENKIRDARGIIGGLIGQNEGEIENSYALTDFSIFLDQVLDIVYGGLVGENLSGGNIINSFSAGTFDAPDEGTTSGFIGSNEGQLIDSYWDTESTGKNDGVGEGNPAGATGLSTAQMTGPAAEQNMPEFDWVNVWRTTEDGYPVLRWEER
jgi:hypothetical protein